MTTVAVSSTSSSDGLALDNTPWPIAKLLMLPVEEVQAGLAETRGRVLQRDVPANEANFDLGGSSLAAVHIVSLVQDRYDLTLDLIDIFDNGDLRALAELGTSG